MMRGTWQSSWISCISHLRSPKPDFKTVLNAGSFEIISKLLFIQADGSLDASAAIAQTIDRLGDLSLTKRALTRAGIKNISDFKTEAPERRLVVEIVNILKGSQKEVTRVSGNISRGCSRVTVRDAKQVDGLPLWKLRCNTKLKEQIMEMEKKKGGKSGLDLAEELHVSDVFSLRDQVALTWGVKPTDVTCEKGCVLIQVSWDDSVAPIADALGVKLGDDVTKLVVRQPGIEKLFKTIVDSSPFAQEMLKQQVYTYYRMQQETGKSFGTEHLSKTHSHRGKVHKAGR